MSLPTELHLYRSPRIGVPIVVVLNRKEELPGNGPIIEGTSEDLGLTSFDREAFQLAPAAANRVKGQRPLLPPLPRFQLAAPKAAMSETPEHAASGAELQLAAQVAQVARAKQVAHSLALHNHAVRSSSSDLARRISATRRNKPKRQQRPQPSAKRVARRVVWMEARAA